MRCFRTSTSRPSASTPISDALSHSDTGREFSRCVVVVYAPGRASGGEVVRLSRGGADVFGRAGRPKGGGVGERRGSDDRGDVGELPGPARSMAHGRTGRGTGSESAGRRSGGRRGLMSMSVGCVVAREDWRMWDVESLAPLPTLPCACVLVLPCPSPLPLDCACEARRAAPPLASCTCTILTPSLPSSSSRPTSPDMRRCGITLPGRLGVSEWSNVCTGVRDPLATQHQAILRAYHVNARATSRAPATLPITAATMIPGRGPWLCARIAAGVLAGEVNGVLGAGEVKVTVVVLV